MSDNLNVTISDVGERGPAGESAEDAILFTSQTLTAPQRAQARDNISAQLASANLDRLDGTVEQQRAAIGAASETSLLGLGNLKVTQKSASSGGTWGPMDGSTLAFLGNSAYLLGGWAGDPYNADWTGGIATNLVYRSNDFGATWVKIKDHDLTPEVGHFVPGHTFAWFTHTVAGTEYIYLVGGDISGTGENLHGDTYRSSDGINWTKVNSVAAGFANIAISAGGVLNGNLYRAGGMNSPGGTPNLVVANNVNSVWRSTDNGVTWTNLGNAPWPAGLIQDRLPLHNGKLWRVGGGVYDNAPENRTFDNAVWSFDGTTWTEVSANGVAPWAGRFYANVFSFGGWLWISRGRTATDNLTDTWRSRDGITWIETDLGPITDKASHADGLGVHSTGFLVASGNGYLDGTPTNADSPSFFVEIEDDKTAGVLSIASDQIDAMRPLDIGVSLDGYTEGTNPRALTPGNNNKLRQINVPNYHSGQPDKTVVGAYVVDGITRVYVGGGLDSSKECAQEFRVHLGADNTLGGDLYALFNLDGTRLRENALGIGTADTPTQGIDLQATTIRMGADESNPNNRTANQAKTSLIEMPNFANNAVVQMFGMYVWNGGKRIYFGGGLNFNEAADRIEFWTTPNNTLGTERLRLDSSGVWINDGGTMKLIEIGAANSGGAGFKMLRIAN